MEDSIEVILQDHGRVLPTSRSHPDVLASVGALLTGIYGVWSLFAIPGFRKIPWRLKVPYLPSSKDQTLNIMTLLKGRTGRLVDLGSGDGRVVFAASSAGFQCTGFEINSILVAYARSKARWKGVPTGQATFVKEDFWKTDLSAYNNVTAFLAPGVVSTSSPFPYNLDALQVIDCVLLVGSQMAVLAEKLLKELPDDAYVISCRFPVPDWPLQSSVGSGLDQTFAYDIGNVRSQLRKVQNTVI
ncbi:uncharacterized protein V6R79_011323 [Siganus canaliculatus]